MTRVANNKSKQLIRVGILIIVLSMIMLCYLSYPYFHQTDTYPLRPDVYFSTEIVP